ncbi:MAG: efflux RND transporter periplasmic adaptor subunit [Sulfuricurvum sp.]|uniref:efflux RND transporter periplasmic adaptor subunit n=1 Tax=Sulfuricurvum sp. TaxID=2025608 RepID=UPI00261650B5|nr:efflux RND transporter periplasmic adaptor subunit [Sulfuricurvum sp.]MDD2829641.1 efflux RND transporter periplasmic adaptor subunit [Sulfuricurvum sp.]MDD4948691.1 efflux RND transporter periplasmic adaptor subunit [Sulfuricurvum sp.]
MNPSPNTIEQTLGLGTPKQSRIKKYLFIGIVIALIALALWWWKTHSDTQTIRYQTTSAQVKTLTTTVSATGNLEPTNTIDVGIEVSGTITDVLVDYNDHVKAGQLMARLDTTKLSSKVTSSKAALARYTANIASAKASLSNAHNEWERVHKMYTSTGGNYPAKQVLDEADNALLSAKASLDAATAQSAQSHAELQADEDNLRKAIVVSPIDGIVLERKIEPGQTVVAAMQTPILFKMAKSLNTMQVIVSVDEADIGEVREKQKVTFTVDAYPNQTFYGVITQLRLNSQIVNGVVTYNALVEVPNDDLRLRPGMTATAQIITGVLPNVLTVSNAALRFTPPKDKKTPEKADQDKKKSGASVWVLRNNKPQKIDVIAGKSDGISTAITSPLLQQNDKIIIGVEEHL